MLRVSNLSIAFGGVKAVRDVSFDVEENSVFAVIGPNGAGKTTLFNLISGLYRPDAGRMLFDGRDLAGTPVEALAGLGISRTFQNLQVCMNMSALDNVMTGAHRRLDQGMFKAMLRWPSLRAADRACREQAAVLMEFAGVGRYRDAQASQMPYGALKRLEIARALAAGPRMLLLDEPAAGLNHTETAEIEQLIGRIAARGTTVVLVEHDMKLVTSVAHRILVLDHGQRIALGGAREVCADPDVIAAYLGSDATAEEQLI